MKIPKYLIITFVLITFWVFSCAPTSENVTSGHQSGNYILLGFWHGVIIPFSVLGKLVGLQIGIWDNAKIFHDLSYSVGYGVSLYIYYSLIKPWAIELWTIIKFST